MDDLLEGEVAALVKELGFKNISRKEVDDGSEYVSDSAEKVSTPLTTANKKKTQPSLTESQSGKVNGKKNKAVSNTLIRDATDRKTKKKTRKLWDSSQLDSTLPAAPPAKRTKRHSSRSGDDQTAEGAVQVAEVSSSVQAVSRETESHQTRWYQLSVTDRDGAEVVDATAKRLQQEAEQVTAQEVVAFKTGGGSWSASDWSWMRTVLTSGTVSDKLAARQSLLRVRPEANLQLLEDTCRMVAAKGKDHAMAAMKMLAALFCDYLLPPGRKLKQFRQQPLGALQSISAGDHTVRKRQLVLWLLEDQLKRLYAEFVERVKAMSHDTVEMTRRSGVNVLAQLLTSHPELEQTLLETLVNKMGDERKAVACLSVRRLSSLLRAHPAMRTVVVKEVERLLFRRNVGKRVQFYGVCFLSQVQFSDGGDEALAERIIGIYVGFFRACVKQAELEARLLRALLTGLSAAVDRAQLLADRLQQYVQPLQHVAQLASFGVATQALQLLFRLTAERSGDGEPSDRFYCALYKKLVHPGLASAQKVADFLNLVYRAVRRDPCLPRARAFVKRLLQCCMHQTAALGCSILLLVSELVRRRPELARLSAEADTRSWAETEDDADDVETPRDLPLPEGEEDEDGRPAAAAAAAAVPAGWLFGAGGARARGRAGRYDALYREPRWCGAERAPLCELVTLRRHLHPSLALFAEQLLTGAAPQYGGNPLQHFQLMHFLNRFCYKNPKKTGQVGDQTARGLAVSSPNFARLDVAQVPHDERFFHRYFRWREEHGLRPAADAVVLTDARGDVTDEAFDDFLDNFFGKKSTKAAAKEVDFMTEIADNDEEAAGTADDAESLGSGEDDDDDDDLDLDSADDGDDDATGFPVRATRTAYSEDRSASGAKLGGDTDLFASAEEFSELIEENENDDDAGSSNAKSNTAKTSRQQLAWEEGVSSKRHRQGKSRTSKIDFRASKAKQQQRSKPKQMRRRRKYRESI